MQIDIACECGNVVKVSDEHADAENRCPRCGRRVFMNEADAIKHYSSMYDAPQGIVSADGQLQTQDSSYVSAETQRNTKFDSEDTVIQSAFVSALPSAEGGAVPMGSVTQTLPSYHDEFVFAHQPASPPLPPSPVNDGSIAKQDSDVTTGQASQSSVKYDLAERVMHVITKPVAPVIPYAGTGEYGIHRILRVHQRGGMGRILVAYDQYLKREVALKELHPDVAEDESIVRRFIGEAEITAQLEHPGVIPIHQIDQGHDGLPYYTMKMIKGDTFQEAIKAYHRNPQRSELLNLVRRLVSVSKTMAFAHSKGVIHRDLKPANVMIGEHGETLVMDWGLAKPYGYKAEDSYISIMHKTKQSQPELTMAGAIVGTPAFMSPEQANSEDHIIGPLSDVFSLGTVLYYLLAGQTAFSGRSTQEVLNKVRVCTPVRPSQIKSNVSHGLEVICLKAMEKLPENRYQGADEFAEDLCRWLDGKPLAAEKNSLWLKIRQGIARHRTLLITVPCVLLLSLVLATAEVWVIGHYAAIQNVLKNDPMESDEYSNISTSGSEGLDIHARYGYQHRLAELILTCRAKATEDHTYAVSINAPVNAYWDLSGRQFLTFSLMEMSPENKLPLQNFSVRLEQGNSYCEYKPNEKMWENRNQKDWYDVSIPLGESNSDWSRKTKGEWEMTKIERLEFHFETDPDTVLNFVNIKFQ